jgi:hypothetical protein
LLSLYQVLIIVIENIYYQFGVQMVECKTVSSLAYKIFVNKYYDNVNKPIPFINNTSVFSDIKLAYYGGRTEVYKPYAKNCYYYDVNSLYPYASLNPMPGLNAQYIEYFNKTVDLNKDLFGFFYCNIKAKENYLGLLPLRTDQGLIFPVGE